MAQYIGSRISLISKRDIRYVGTLHEISSENSTVALEQVVSFGTEGRHPQDEVPPSDNVYEYIVFRGSDVKDLTIEKEPVKKPAEQPQVPDDPAILGNARPTRTSSLAAPSHSHQHPNFDPSQQQVQGQQRQPPQQYNQQQQHRQHPQGFQQPHLPYQYPPPPNQRFGPPGPQGFHSYGYPGMPYGPPPDWFPPPGQRFPHPPGQFFPPSMPPGPPGQASNQQGPMLKPDTPADPSAIKGPNVLSPKQPAEKPTATVKLPSATTTPAPQVVAQSGPPPPTESKPDVAAALAPPAGNQPNTAKQMPGGPKSGRIMPAVPMISPAAKSKVAVAGVSQVKLGNAPATTAQAAAEPALLRPSQVPTKSMDDATRDAKAAVAAAMAKLPPAPGQKKQTNGESAMDNLTNKVNELRTNDNIRTSRQPGTGGYAAGNRGGRGGHRGGRPRTESSAKRMEVPKTDYDFATANAKFNKQDLVKEVTATGSPLEIPLDGFHEASAEASVNGARKESEQSVSVSVAHGYNSTSSFFDNISSESKDREEATSKRLGGREFRAEEQKKNLETFGQGSVDNGYRGGFRGRGRGRGFRGGRGGRGGPRGRGVVVTEN